MNGVDTVDSKADQFSPSPYVFAGYATIFLAFGVFGTWAATAPLESAVVASGTVSVESNRKMVQHLEGGIVSEIFAKEGDIVEVGDVLIRLDKTQAQSNYTVLEARLVDLQAAEARLLAESVNSMEMIIPAHLVEVDQAEARQAVVLQSTLFDDRKRTKDGQIAILRARVDQLNEGIKGFELQLAAVDGQKASFDEEIHRLTKGRDDGIVATNQVAQMNRARLGLLSDQGQITAEIAKLRQTIAETELQIVQISQEFVERAGSDLRQVRDQLSEVQERTIVARDVLERTDIEAAVRGIVQNVRVHTKGGVVSRGEPLLDIIPLDDNLVVSARIRPVDIDIVNVGDVAEVRFSAFSSRTTPVIFGRTTVLSSDVIEPTRQGEEPYYQARVVVDDESIPMELRGRLVPGMPADIIIATGERTLFQYLVKPLSDSFLKGIREE